MTAGSVLKLRSAISGEPWPYGYATPREAGGTDASAAPSEPSGYTPVSSTDAAELTHDVRDWNFEFMQLSSGKFRASGAMLQLDGVSIARVSMERTLLQRGFAARGMFAVFIPALARGPYMHRVSSWKPDSARHLWRGRSLKRYRTKVTWMFASD